MSLPSPVSFSDLSSVLPSVLSSDKRVTLFGGSGFVGRHIVRRLAKTGVRLRIGVRHPNEALFLKTAGRVGQIDVVGANIRNRKSIEAALEGADAVVNMVGILYERGTQKFADIHAAGAGLLAQCAAQKNIARFIQISAIGADEAAASRYATSKARGENLVTAAIPTAHILRPSLIIGPEDSFFNRFASMAQIVPALPLIGGGLTRYQPVSVFDVAEAVAACLDRTPAGVYELGGPVIFTFRQLMEMLLCEIGRSRLLVPMPFALARVIASVAQFAPTPLITPDQVLLLKYDNIVGDGFGDRGLAALGVTPTPIGTLLPSYLHRYRPAGKKASRLNG